MVAALVTVSFFIGCEGWGGWADAHLAREGMTMAFLTMSMAEIFHSLNMRSQRESIFTLKSHNKVLYIAGGVSMLATVLVCAVPPLAGFFSLNPIGIGHLGIALGLGVLVVPIVECVKFIQRKISARKAV
jgi:Ca2+-transporting ATPase